MLDRAMLYVVDGHLFNLLLGAIVNSVDVNICVHVYNFGSTFLFGIYT